MINKCALTHTHKVLERQLHLTRARPATHSDSLYCLDTWSSSHFLCPPCAATTPGVPASHCVRLSCCRKWPDRRWYLRSSKTFDTGGLWVIQESLREVFSSGTRASELEPLDGEAVHGLRVLVEFGRDSYPLTSYSKMNSFQLGARQNVFFVRALCAPPFRSLVLVTGHI